METAILAAIPSPPQGVWYLGPVAIRAYALCILTGVMVAYLWSKRRYAATGGNVDVVTDAIVVGLPVGIIGARLYHVATDYHRYFGEGQNPWRAFNITNGGLGVWGGIAAGALAIIIMLKVRGIPVAPFAWAVAPTIPVAQAIGRFGNWFNQEIYGGPSDAPWALNIYRRVNEQGVPDNLYGRSTGEVLATVQPTFLYEALWCIGLAIFLVWIGKRVNGTQLILLYVAGYTLGRFFIESMRTDEATLLWDSIRVNSVVAAVTFIVAVVALLFVSRTSARARATVQEDAHK